MTTLFQNVSYPVPPPLLLPVPLLILALRLTPAPSLTTAWPLQPSWGCPHPGPTHLSWMTLTASFCQSTLCVTGRTICFKNKCDQISPLPKNLETLLLPLEVTVSSHVVCSLPTGEHNGGGTQRVMLSALPGGLTHPRGSTALASLVVPVSGTTTAVHTGHWRRSCQQIVTVCTLGTVLSMLT